MFEIDSTGALRAPESPEPAPKRRRRTRDDAVPPLQKAQEIQQFPAWARVPAGGSERAIDAAFFAGAALARLDAVLRSGADVLQASQSSAPVGTEPIFAGALRQRLALRAAGACAAMARLREDEAALRDAEHLASLNAAPTPGGRLHRLWRLFAANGARHDARHIRKAADYLDLPPDIDCEALASLTHERSTAESPLGALADITAMTSEVLDDGSQIDAEIFVLWLADLALARRLAWEAPLPLLATMITHPSLRGAHKRRPRPSDPDWSSSISQAYARAAQEACAMALDLARRSQTLLQLQTKLRAKGAARVVDLLLSDDCVSASQAAKAAGLSDRASRRLFDRLIAFQAVRELSGRSNFRLYGL